MDFIEGHGVLGMIRFPDGETPKYNRTYLVVTVTEKYIEVLNVSSIEGKERKLAYAANMVIHKYNPPFLKPSFVKLDSLTRVDKSNWSNLRILNNGRTLNSEELAQIKKELNDRNNQNADNYKLKL